MRTFAYLVKTPTGAVGKAASLAEYAELARKPQGKVLVRELDRAYGRKTGGAGGTTGRIAWREYEKLKPEFEARVIAARDRIEHEYKEL